MSKEISRRTFLKIAGAAAGGIALGALGLKGKIQENHQIFLPFVAKEEEPEEVDDLLTLLDPRL